MTPPPPETPARFSVVVPTYNRPARLAACLAAVAALDYPRDAFEVVVVDDGSDADGAERAIRDAVDASGWPTCD